MIWYISVSRWKWCTTHDAQVRSIILLCPILTFYGTEERFFSLFELCPARGYCRTMNNLEYPARSVGQSDRLPLTWINRAHSTCNRCTCCRITSAAANIISYNHCTSLACWWTVRCKSLFGIIWAATNSRCICFFPAIVLLRRVESSMFVPVRISMNAALDDSTLSSVSKNEPKKNCIVHTKTSIQILEISSWHTGHSAKRAASDLVIDVSFCFWRQFPCHDSLPYHHEMRV